MPPLLSLTKFSLSVRSTVLLDSIDVQVSRGQCVAVAGPNGCGKSTLLKAIAHLARWDEQESDDVEQVPYFVSGAAEQRVCSSSSVLHVEQDSLQWSRLWPEAQGLAEEAELRSLPLPDALDLLVAEGVDSAMEDADGWRRLSVAANEKLGWSAAAYDTTPIDQLSPGCAVRAYLALALQRPGIELLLLDEPTNHLDLPSILWLQASIRASGKAVLVVSHDAPFMDDVCDTLWVIDPHSHALEVSAVSYSDHRRATAARLKRQAEEYEAQQKRHRKLTAAAEKLRAASSEGSRFAGKDHDKLQRDFKRDRAGRSGRKAKAIETNRDSEQLIEKVARHVPLRIIFDPFAAGADSSVMANQVVLGHGGVALPLPPLTLRVDFGERVAIVGFNGVGKSTLLRTLLGAQQPLSGEVQVGRELLIGNLTQEHESLPREATPRQHFANEAGVTLFDAGAHLHRHGITRGQVDRPIAALNPGARARVLLALFAVRKVNALVLDEPTNHLDEEAVGEVLASLNSFQGTVVVVSHSREFLEAFHQTRVLQLSSDGLCELPSLGSFIEQLESSIGEVVHQCVGP